MRKLGISRAQALAELARAVLCEPLPSGEQSQLDAIRDQQLVKDSRHIVFHGELTDPETFGNLSVAHTLDDCFHDFQLSGCQAEVSERVAGSFAAAQHADQLGDDFTFYPDFSIHDHPDAAEEGLRGGVFSNDAGCAE